MIASGSAMMIALYEARLIRKDQTVRTGARWPRKKGIPVRRAVNEFNADNGLKYIPSKIRRVA